MQKERVVIYLPQKLIDKVEQLQRSYEIPPTLTAVYEHLINAGLEAQKEVKKCQ